MYWILYIEITIFAILLMIYCILYDFNMELVYQKMELLIYLFAGFFVFTVCLYKLYSSGKTKVSLGSNLNEK
jgi:hypothetical protein